MGQKAAGASLRRKHFGCGGRGVGRPAPLCAPRPTCSVRRVHPLAPDPPLAQCPPLSPRPRPPPGAGRAGGVVRARVTARFSRGASTGAVSPRTAQRGPPEPADDAVGAPAQAGPLTAPPAPATPPPSPPPPPPPSRRQWTREPPRRSTVGAAPAAPPPPGLRGWTRGGAAALVRVGALPSREAELPGLRPGGEARSRQRGQRCGRGTAGGTGRAVLSSPGGPRRRVRDLGAVPRQTFLPGAPKRLPWGPDHAESDPGRAQAGRPIPADGAVGHQVWVQQVLRGLAAWVPHAPLSGLHVRIWGNRPLPN
ncbi:hypothetical protein P7K49_015183 [Saguinus oedipus]|uniref:Basic proline-rich protein-like n=1 Tax=Saguinus oedipus TaxID=9490 RepID=A0ABQ9V9R4_SAGOE|nr:hypothetical protein P7K49_015183 [Saguinus oedipus]